MSIRETVARWIDTIGALEAINLTLFAILIVGGTAAILWARSRAREAKRQWREEGATAFHDAEARMDSINREMTTAARDIRAHGQQILERVRKDTGVRR